MEEYRLVRTLYYGRVFEITIGSMVFRLNYNKAKEFLKGQIPNKKTLLANLDGRSNELYRICFSK